MTLAHGAHGTSSGALVLVTASAVVGAGYAVLAWRRRREPRGWGAWRTISFLAGIALLVLAVLPFMSPWPVGDLRGHMLQHLIIGMLAPIGLVLGAPLTLILRTVPRRWGRRIGRLLHTRPVRVLVHPVTALMLTVGGMVALYCTPLHQVATDGSVVHHLTHAHLLTAGYLFAWTIAGPDPAPRRPSVPTRLVVLGVAILAHAVVSQLLYAGLVGGPIPAPERRGAAELMYYGGDIAEIMLALAILTTWRPRRGPTARVRAAAASDGRNVGSVVRQ